jgi:hypothetical protein
VVDGLAGLFQTAHDERGHLGIIFDDEDAHEWRAVSVGRLRAGVG